MRLEMLYSENRPTFSEIIETLQKLKSDAENYLGQKDIKVGKDVDLVVLDRYTPSELYVFD